MPSRSPSGPRAATSSSTRSSAPRRITKDGVTVAKEIELEDPSRTWARRWSSEVASKTSDIAGDGTTTATVLAQAHRTRGPQERRRRRQPDVRSSAASTRPSRPPSPRLARSSPRRSTTAKEIARSPPSPPTGDDDDRQHHRRGHGQGRQGRRHHRRGGQGHRDHTRRRRGHAVRQGLPRRPTSSPTPRRMEAVLEDAYILIAREEDLQRCKELLPAAREGRPGRQAAARSSPRTSRARPSPRSS